MMHFVTVKLVSNPIYRAWIYGQMKSIQKLSEFESYFTISYVETQRWQWLKFLSSAYQQWDKRKHGHFTMFTSIQWQMHPSGPLWDD